MVGASVHVPHRNSSRWHLFPPSYVLDRCMQTLRPIGPEKSEEKSRHHLKTVPKAKRKPNQVAQRTGQCNLPKGKRNISRNRSFQRAPLVLLCEKVGLASMLVLLVELVEITWTQLGVSVLPHQAEPLLLERVTCQGGGFE